MKNNFVTYNKVVRKLAEFKSSTAHSLIELSERQWKRLQSRCLMLTKMVSHKTMNNRVEYKKYAKGSDLCPSGPTGTDFCLVSFVPP